MKNFIRRTSCLAILAAILLFQSCKKDDQLVVKEEIKASTTAISKSQKLLPAPPIPDGIYKIRNYNSSKVLEISERPGTNGTPIQQWTDYGAAYQKWEFRDLGNGYYRIKSVYSDKVMDVNRSSMNDGAWVHQWTWDNGIVQQWALISLGNGRYLLQNGNSGKVLDIAGGSIENGIQANQNTRNNGWSQQWSIEPA
ncbi:RICIN domain-containing protein [Chitinophaga flava]|uniref:Ricin B lectin domain-containing protein n=1 Tax=Chitinophaga flava TaxID=2259036 RepID=A0A365XWU7_9BACT|nr:RICIN domain-containing protein [Chitinophaga flava]RBL90055.1 hypothetical protein DF182_26655 [Chitinophaga flava]